MNLPFTITLARYWLFLCLLGLRDPCQQNSVPHCICEVPRYRSTLHCGVVGTRAFSIYATRIGTLSVGRIYSFFHPSKVLSSLIPICGIPGTGILDNTALHLASGSRRLVAVRPIFSKRFPVARAFFDLRLFGGCFFSCHCCYGAGSGWCQAWRYVRDGGAGDVRRGAVVQSETGQLRGDEPYRYLRASDQELPAQS